MDLFKWMLKERTKQPSSLRGEPAQGQTEEHRLNASLADTTRHIQSQMGNSSDLLVREFTLGKNGVNAALVCIDGLVNKTIIQQLLESLMLLMDDEAASRSAVHESDDLTEYIYKNVIVVGDLHYVSDLESVYTAILSGYTFIGINGYLRGLIVETSGAAHRQVTTPTSQSVIRGPQEGFTESISTNVALIRKRIKDPNLWMDMKNIGRVTQTAVAVMYIHGIAEEKIVAEVYERLSRIDIDGILESNYIEEFIQDKTFTLFPTVYNTERPDVVAAALLEGRIAILVDGTPFVLLAPALFMQFMQAAEDYYHSSDFGFFRLLRFIALFISILAPSLYVAITTFHQEMLPTSLLISLAAQREGIPFPAFVETFTMEVTFELLREASVRMPKGVSTSISIVGALVLGTAAVEAGLVSAAIVIVVSITAITSFIFPNMEFGISTRILRFAFMILAASFGLFGIIVFSIFIVLHLCHLQSFGVPYMSPFAPFNLSDQKDNLVRVPWWKMYLRPQSFSRTNKYRQPTTIDPKERQENSAKHDEQTKGIRSRS